MSPSRLPWGTSTLRARAPSPRETGDCHDLLTPGECASRPPACPFLPGQGLPGRNSTSLAAARIDDLRLPLAGGWGPAAAGARRGGGDRRPPGGPPRAPSRVVGLPTPPHPPDNPQELRGHLDIRLQEGEAVPLALRQHRLPPRAPRGGAGGPQRRLVEGPPEERAAALRDARRPGPLPRRHPDDIQPRELPELTELGGPRRCPRPRRGGSRRRWGRPPGYCGARRRLGRALRSAPAPLRSWRSAPAQR